MPDLSQSPEITRGALEQIVAAKPPAEVDVDNTKVSLQTEREGDSLRVVATWPDGKTELLVRVRRGIERRTADGADDKGHTLGLGVYAGEDAEREVIWRSFEWNVRDAIRAKKNEVRLDAQNSYFGRPEDAAAGLDRATLGARARAVAASSGLPAAPTVELGRFDLGAGWSDPTATLERLLKLALIKAHVMDRGEGNLVKGRPLFALGTAPAPVPVPTPSTKDERLSGLVMMVGTASEYLPTLASWLAAWADDPQSEAATVAWIMKTADVTENRARALLRLLVHTGLVAVSDDRVEPTEAGSAFAERPDGSVLYEALRATFDGFEETLLFFERNPDTGVPQLHAGLNRAMDAGWQSHTQPRARAYWLLGCGLLEGKQRYRLTESGRRAAAALPASVRAGIESLPAATEPAEVDDLGSLRLDPARIDLGSYVCPPGVLARCCAALAAGKHLLLVGPPGTGKSTLATLLAEHVAEASGLEPPLLATASADWTTYATIGGWTQRASQALEFREGVVTRALRERSWLVLDEVNRADVDKCFGELFTVLAGGTVTTAYTRTVDGHEVPIEIGPDATPYRFGPWFRLIATMNVRDKSSLFRLSFAFLRRFAVVEVPGLDDDALGDLAARAEKEANAPAGTGVLAANALSTKHLGAHVPLGPSMLLDVVRYAAARNATAVQGVGEGVELLVLPQLDGLADGAAAAAFAKLGELFSADAETLASLRRAFRASYPHVKLDA